MLAELGEKVKQYRWDKRLTLDAMAAKAGVSLPIITNLEKGVVKNITLNKLIDICDAIEHNVALELTPAPVAQANAEA